MVSNEKKILIVDDDPDILEALQLTFELEGYTAYAIIKADEACQVVEKLHPDLIILDVALAGEDGRHICKKLKNAESTKNIPIIMVSAQLDVIHSIKAVGANDFVAKPFDIDTLLGRAEQFLI